MNVKIYVSMEDYHKFRKGESVVVGGVGTNVHKYVEVVCDVDEVEFDYIDVHDTISRDPYYGEKEYGTGKRIVSVVTNRVYYVKRKIIPKSANDDIRVGDTVIIRDAMDPSYIGKEGIVEAISEHSPICYKLNIDGQPGSWANAWLRSMVTKKI